MRAKKTNNRRVHIAEALLHLFKIQAQLGTMMIMTIAIKSKKMDF
jgi:hypothetical protein